MSRTQKGPSFLSGALGLFKGGKPTKVKTNTARKTSARILSRQTMPGASSPYRAVEIVAEDTACDAVKTIAGKRLLLRDVSLLPVRDCTSAKCQCSYIRYNDRRDESGDRRALFSVRTKQFVDIGNEEKRRRTDRRADLG